MKLGVVAAKRQTAMVMHVDYQVRLPSHDYAVASKHYFIPSVYSFLTILPSSIGQKNAVTYSGPTGVFLRSGKHDQTNACTHRVDLTTLILSPKFKEYTHNSRGFKKVLVLRSDNSPDEAPRNPSTQKKMIQLFIKFDLVMLVLASLPAGYSLFNPCERRMAPLSKVLTGVLLDHKHYGSHLNSQKQTVDGVLEIRNFKYAGDRLAQLFGHMVYDKHKTYARYVDPPAVRGIQELPTSCMPVDVNAEWIQSHVVCSKYLLQNIACDIPTCCPNRPSHVKKLLRPWLPNGSIPPPTKLQHEYLQEELPLSLAKQHMEDKAVKFVTLPIRVIYPCAATTPFDAFCPSMKDKLVGTICDVCKTYFTSKAQMLVHRKSLHKFERYKNTNVSELLRLEHSKNLENLDYIIDHSSTNKEYKAMFQDGSVDWITIVNDNNPKVKAYMNEVGIDCSEYDTSNAGWMVSAWNEN